MTVKHKTSSREVKTFAMLSNCSQGTFVKEALLKKLEIGGRATLISVETLNRKNTFQLHTVDALQVCYCNTNSKKRCLNILRNTPEWTSSKFKWSSYIKETQKWKDLERMLDEFSERDDIQVDLLIGSYCVKALEPLKVICQAKHKVLMLTRLCLDGVCCRSNSC